MEDPYDGGAIGGGGSIDLDFSRKLHGRRRELGFLFAEVK